MAPANIIVSFALPVEEEPLFFLALERLQTLYPGAYAHINTSTSEGAENLDLDVKLSARTHPGAAGSDSFLGGGNPLPPTQLPLLVDAPIDLFPVTQNTWLDGGSAYRGQDTLAISALTGAETD